MAMINLKKELRESSSPFPTAMYNIGGPNISASEIPVSLTSKPNWEALALLVWKLVEYTFPPRDIEILGWCPAVSVLPHGEKVSL